MQGTVFSGTRWSQFSEPNDQEIRQIFTREGLKPYRWSNNPLDDYGAHTHPYNKVIIVISGSITFGLPKWQEEIEFRIGDRLDLPRGVVHKAVVGQHGVICLEAHK